MSRKTREIKGLHISLEEYRIKANKKPREISNILRGIEQAMKYKKYSLTNTLTNAEFHENLGHLNQKNLHYYQHILELHILGGVPLEYFNFYGNEDLFKALKSFSVNKQDSSKDEKESNLVEMHKSSIQTNIGDSYFNNCNLLLNNVKGSLFVYEYLDRFYRIDEHDKEDYVERHEKIFEKIEKILKNSTNNGIPQIKYARLLALPMGKGELPNLRERGW
ncbi:hypothetical protein Q4Q35_10845 [Flavivirga aquimarina]|uniref:Uncharacterized protein n=1 Tax=Flavivirga aquimarina TaxID=2027862 RepID=A0ABT8WAX8_9FLAO|nr:hypothetical protein [Flavivirga aquimarina]MDO5970303.1 hypothetical protein [Flavivirga aquimarina]